MLSILHRTRPRSMLSAETKGRAMNITLLQQVRSATHISILASTC